MRSVRDVHLEQQAAIPDADLWGDPYDLGGTVKPHAGSLHHHRPTDNDEPLLIVGMP